MKTFFNKFVKRGKKATAVKHMYRALQTHRMLLPGVALYETLCEHMRRLGWQVQLVLVRKATKFLEVPVPAKRLKATVGALQAFYNAASARPEKVLSERVFSELFDLTKNRWNSRALRAKSTHYARVFEMRIHMEKRWK